MKIWVSMGAQVLKGELTRMVEKRKRLGDRKGRESWQRLQTVWTQSIHRPLPTDRKKKKTTNVCMSDFKPQDGLKLVILVVLMVCKSKGVKELYIHKRGQ